MREHESKRDQAPQADHRASRKRAAGGADEGARKAVRAERSPMIGAGYLIGEARVEEGEGMDLVEAPEATEEARARLQEEAVADAQALTSVLNKFQSILRRRKAEPALAKAIGKGLFEEKLQDRMLDFFQDKARETLLGVAEGAEMAGPVGGALKAVGEVKGVVDGHVQASQAGAELAAIDGIVRAMEGRVFALLRQATARLHRASAMEIARLAQAKHAAVDEVAILAHLDALLLEAMRQSGTQTVHEQLDALGRRRQLGDEIEAAGGGGKRG